MAEQEVEDKGEPETDSEKEEDEFEKKIKDKPDLPKKLGKVRKDDANEEVG
jgi:hypothetical protein